MQHPALQTTDGRVATKSRVRDQLCSALERELTAEARATRGGRDDGADMFGDTGVDMFGDTGVDMFGDTGVDMFGDTAVEMFGDT